jgi:hypothetical protein
MAAYWWACEKCDAIENFIDVCGYKGIAHYIWDILLASSWDQDKLLLACKACGQRSLRIAYDFPGGDKISLRVVHIVGLGPIKGEYVPMMWETYPISEINERWFDFKYVKGRSVWGLNKPAVFSPDKLSEIFALYQNKVGVAAFH